LVTQTLEVLMNEFLNLSPKDFNLFLMEEAQYRSPAEIDDLRRRYRDANSFAGAIQRTLAPEEGRRRSAFLPVDAPQGMSIWDALTSGEASPAVPQGLVDMLFGGSRAVESAAEYAQGIPPRADAMGDAMNVAGMTMLSGGVVAAPKGSVRSGFVRSIEQKYPDVAERGDAIIGMLKSGRAADITDDMLDMGDSVKNTQLNQYLFQNYDLPMDEASRMARAAEMGFEGDFLHGTGSDIAAVDTSKLGEKQNVLGKGFYQTTNPKRSERYVPRVTDEEGNRVFAEGGNIMPLMTKSADEFDLTAQTGKENITRIANAFEGAGFDVKLRDGGDSVSIKSKTDPRMSAFLDSYQDGQATLMRLKDAFGNNNITPILQEAGFTGVKGFEGRGSNVRVNYNPQDVRSRFARFDPRLSHLSDLTASNMSPLGGLVAQGMVSQEEIEQYLKQKGM
jgi:hypothetical protein